MANLRATREAVVHPVEGGLRVLSPLSLRGLQERDEVVPADDLLLDQELGQ
jgi:hypothetical protein